MFLKRFIACASSSASSLALSDESRFTKDDWEMFLAAAYYDEPSSQPLPQPSQLSQLLFSSVFAFANTTQNR